MTGGKSGLVVKKSVLAIAGLVTVVLIIGSGLIGHYAFPYSPDDNQEDGSLTTVQPTTIDPSVLTDFRLPSSLAPTHYEVRLQPFINGNYSIQGHIRIHIDVVEATSNITIHLADIETHNDTIQVSHEATGDTVVVSSHSYDVSREWYVGFLEEDLAQGDKIILEMDFTGYLNDKLIGFYRSSYVNAADATIQLAATQFQATDARRAFPCFDEPGLKARFTISLARETSMTTISNMPINTTVTIDDEWEWDHYETSVPMSTYLVAFIISDFMKISASDAADPTATEFNVWVRPTAEAQAEYAKSIGPRTLEFFEEYFQIPYPLPKQDMIAIPDFDAGAMENWGLIIYRETAMLYDENYSSASDKQYVGIVVAHELAHQWFGNLVTPSWWTDLWLNEGFATYMEYVGMHAIEPTWKMMEQFVATDLHRVMAVDSLENSHPISIPVQQPDQIDEIFDIITYSKGASIIRMMDHFLTNAMFKEGLINYLNAFKYEAAEQDDLWQSLTDSAGDLLPTSVKEIMDTWTLQMGYPVLNVIRSEDGTSATVSQSRFLLIASNHSEDAHDYKWWIPISYISTDLIDFSDTTPKIWMNETETEITIDGLPGTANWVIFNIQETGYYRVNYDVNNWNKIIEHLVASHSDIHESNRAQLIDDSMSLARAGQLSYDIALEVNSYLSKETDYVPWRSALTSFQYLEKMMTRTEAYGHLKQYILFLLVPLYTHIGFDETTTEHLDYLTRDLAVSWACQLGHADCLVKSVQRFADDATFNDISPNLKTTIYCTAIAEGSEKEWNKAWEQYQLSNVASEKDQILSALGCSQELWILTRFLDYTFTEGSGIRKQDARTAFRAVARNDVGNQLTWNYLKSNWNTISEYFGTFTTLGDLIAYVADEFNTPVQQQELETFYADHSEQLGTATRAIEQAIESVGNNVAWMETNYELIKTWLENKYVIPVP